MIYVMGSLRHDRPGEVARQLREAGFDVFDDWRATHPNTDDEWRDYEISRGRGFIEALAAPAAQNVFQFDKANLDRADTGVLVCPAGRSAHLELGYMLGGGKRGYILLDDPDRWDVMYNFATGVVSTVDDLLFELSF